MLPPTIAMDNTCLPVSRRRVLKQAGVYSSLGGVAMVAGCLGNEGQQDTTTTTAAGDGSDADSSEWPDLSGEEVHVLTDENSDPMKNYFNGLAESFESATGATLEIEFLSGGTNVEQRASQLIQAGNPPEIAHVGVSSSTSLVHQGSVRQLNDPLSTWMDKYGEPATNSRLRFEDDDYLIPLVGSSGTLWYREDVYDQHPETWEDLLNQAEKHDGSQGVTGTYVPASSSFFCSGLYALYFGYSNNATVCKKNDNGEIYIAMDEGSNKTRWVETLDYLKKLHQYSPSATDAGCGSLVEAVAGGKSASVVYGGARPKVNAEQNNMDFAGDIRSAKQPKKRSHKSSGIFEGFVSFEGSNVKGGNTFLNFLSDIQRLVDFYLITPVHLGPLWEGVTSSDLYKEGLEKLPDAWKKPDDYETPFHQLDNNLVVLSTEVSGGNPWAGAIGGSGEIGDLVYETLIQEVDVESAIDKRAANLRDVLKEARG